MSRRCAGLVQHLPAHELQRILDNAGHMGTGILMQHDHTPREHARTLSLDGGTKVSADSKVAFFADSDARVL
jgi:hypothetical protein